MGLRRLKKALPPVALFLLLGALLLPLFATGEAGPVTPSQGQLSALVGAAAESGAYASSLVGFAASHNLTVSTSLALVDQGNALLVAARADAQVGENLSAGLQAVNAAMSDYSSAAAGASLAIGRAGLSYYADYSIALGAVAEVNATVQADTSIAAEACAGAGAGSGSFAQACSQAAAGFSGASADLAQAATLLARSNGSASGALDVSQALALVAMARAEVNGTQSQMASLALHSYSERGEAYVATVIEPASAEANASILSESAFNGSLGALLTDFGSYSGSAASASENLTTSASALASAIASVYTASVSSNITAAESVAAQVRSNMSGLETLAETVPPALQGSLVIDIEASLASEAAYSSALGASGTLNGGFGQTTVASFSQYLSSASTAYGEVQTTGTTYVSSYGQVQSELSNVINLGGIDLGTLAQLQAYAGTLGRLYPSVSSTSAFAESSLQLDLSALRSVNDAMSVFSSATATASSSLPVPVPLQAASLAASTGGTTFLNSSGSSVLGSINGSVSATAADSAGLLAKAELCSSGSVSGFAANSAALAASSASFGTQAKATTSLLARASALVSSDLALRMGLASSGLAESAKALVLLSEGEPASGAFAMAQAAADLQLASEAGA